MPQKKRQPSKPIGTKKPNPYGTDYAFELRAPKGKKCPLCYWDVWFLLVATKDFGCDLDRMASRLRELRDKVSSFNGEKHKANLRHVRDLQRRLRKASIEGECAIREANRFKDAEEHRALAQDLRHVGPKVRSFRGHAR